MKDGLERKETAGEETYYNDLSIQLSTSSTKI